MRMPPRLRVETLLVAARRTFGPGRSEALIDALAAESGLHPSNIERALDRALELSPTEAQLEAMLARAPQRTAVMVILAANVFLAPLRAIAWALAQSDRVIVRPSRRAPTFARRLVAAAPALELELVELDPEAIAALELPEGAAIHAYGTRPTLDAIAAGAQRGVELELHGPGFGAMIGDAEDYVAAAAEIAEDIALFDQAGCLSPRIALVVGADAARAADALHRALESVGDEIPRRTLAPVETAALLRSRDAATFAGRALEGSEHLILELPEATLAPAGRVLVIASVARVEDAIARLQVPELATIGVSMAYEARVRAAFPQLRLAPLGEMQRPPLDGPVDLRVLPRSRV